jgi:hypothetical protein
MTVASPQSVSSQRLLWDALVLPLPQAEDAWRRWRESTDLEHLDNRSFHLLPALAGRMPAWIGNDPQRAILLGICRRAWSQNQVCRKLLADALEILSAAGIDRVAPTGPILWGALYWPDGAIRPIGSVDLLLEPVSLKRAFEALCQAGWNPANGIPDTAGNFYFDRGVSICAPSGGEVRVHWRALPNTDFSLRRPQPPPLEAIQPGQPALNQLARSLFCGADAHVRARPPGRAPASYLIPAEYSLVAALGGEHEDGLGWHYDAMMISRQPRLNWDVVAALLKRRTAARDRLDELQRDWGAEIPSEVTKQAWTSGMESIITSALRAYRRRKARSVVVRNIAK